MFEPCYCTCIVHLQLQGLHRHLIRTRAHKQDICLPVPLLVRAIHHLHLCFSCLTVMKICRGLSIGWLFCPSKQRKLDDSSAKGTGLDSNETAECVRVSKKCTFGNQEIRSSWLRRQHSRASMGPEIPPSQCNCMPQLVGISKITLVFVCRSRERIASCLQTQRAVNPDTRVVQCCFFSTARVSQQTQKELLLRQSLS